MKKSTALAAVAALALLGMAQQKPLNDKCPVKGEPVKPGISLEVAKGKVVGFC